MVNTWSKQNLRFWDSHVVCRDHWVTAWGPQQNQGKFQRADQTFWSVVDCTEEMSSFAWFEGLPGKKKKKVYIYYLEYRNNEKCQSCSLLAWGIFFSSEGCNIHLCWLSDKEKYVVRLESLLSYQSQDESAKPVEGDVICHPPDMKKWTSAWTCHHPPQTPLESMSGHSPQT